MPRRARDLPPGRTEGNPQLSALWLTDPGEAVLRCRLALIAAGGIVRRAARTLQIRRETLHRWIKAHPEIRKDL